MLERYEGGYTMSFEEAKQFLRREEDEGNSLYDHLSKVLLKVIIEKVRSDRGRALRRDPPEREREARALSRARPRERAAHTRDSAPHPRRAARRGARAAPAPPPPRR